MAGDIDDVIGAPHDEQVAILVEVAAVAGEVVAGEGGHVGAVKALRIAPHPGQAARRQRLLDHHTALLHGAGRLALPVEDLHVETGHRHRGTAGLGGHRLEAVQVGGNGPAGLGLPPVIDHRHRQQVVEPVEGRRIQALAGQEQRLEATDVVLCHQLGVRILLLDGAKGGGRGEEALHPILADQSPEGAGIRGLHRLALVDHGGGAAQQRRIDDIGVADHPPHVRGGEEDLARRHVVDGLHGVGQRHGIAAGIAHHALGLAGGTGGVEDIERIAALDRHAVSRCCPLDQGRPVMVDRRAQLGGVLLALQDHAGLGLVAALLDGGIDDRLVGQYPVALDAAGGGDHHLRLGVLDAHRQLVGREAAEHHRVNGPETGTGIHGDQGLGHHGHVDHHPVALLHAQVSQGPGEARHLVTHLREGEGALAVGDR